MKPFKAKTICAFARYAIAYFLITSATLQLHAQCASGLKITSYSIFLNGTGNNGWGFSIPQFDPSVGTLVAVDIRSVVSVNMNFQLASFDTLQNNYIVLAGRNDNISVSALNSPISNAVSQDYGPYSLQPPALSCAESPFHPRCISPVPRCCSVMRKRSAMLRFAQGSA